MGIILIATFTRHPGRSIQLASASVVSVREAPSGMSKSILQTVADW